MKGYIEIVDVLGREVMDSRGNPTVEVEVTLDDGTGTDRQILSGIAKYYRPEELVGKTVVAILNLPPRKMMGIDSCGMLISAVHHVDGEERLNLLMVDGDIPAGAKLY